MLLTESVATATWIFQVLRLGEAVPDEKGTYEYQIPITRTRGQPTGHDEAANIAILWGTMPYGLVEASWNVMAHARKPDFVFLRNGRVHLNRRGASVQSTTGSRGVRISGSNAGYTMFRGSAKGTGYPLHSPVSPSLPLTCVNHVPSYFNWTLK